MQGLEGPQARAKMLLHQQSVGVEEVAKVLEDYAAMVGDKKKQQQQQQQGGAAASAAAAAAAVGEEEEEEEATAAAAAEAEAASIRSLASVLT